VVEAHLPVLDHILGTPGDGPGGDAKDAAQRETPRTMDLKLPDRS
jgi:hypothetical protein